MREQLLEAMAELADRWDDPYYWADHQALQAVLVASIIGVIGLGFKYLELSMERTMTSEVPGP